MLTLLAIILDSIRSTGELCLFVLLPIMVVMMAVMKLLQASGLLLSPRLSFLGIWRLSVVAALQQLFVSFAAPPTTLAIMVQKETPSRVIAATLAMVLAMSQANATFPLTVLGLNLWQVWLTSVIGGLAAATLTYRFFFRASSEEAHASAVDPSPEDSEWLGFFRTAFDGALDGLRLILKSAPIIFLAILAVNTIEAIGALAWLESELAPALSRIGLPSIAILPIVTKYLAGGTAMMGVTLDLVREGTLSIVALNRVAGFTINPLDAVGLAVLTPVVAGRPGVIRPAIFGAIGGILVRGVLHLTFS